MIHGIHGIQPCGTPDPRGSTAAVEVVNNQEPWSPGAILCGSNVNIITAVHCVKCTALCRQMHSVLHSAQCTAHSGQCTVLHCSAQCTAQCTVHSSERTVHSASAQRSVRICFIYSQGRREDPSTVLCSALQCTTVHYSALQCTVHSVLHCTTVHSAQCTRVHYSALDCTVHSTHNVLNTVCPIWQYSMHTVHHLSVLCTWFIVCLLLSLLYRECAT